MTSGNLPLDDATDIDARLADNESTELQDDLRTRQPGVKALQYGCEIVADQRDIEPLVAGEVRNPQAAADVEDANRTRRVLREAHGELDAFPLRFGDRIRTEVLGAAEDVEALEVKRERGHPVEHRGHPLGVDAERLGPAAPLHARALQLAVRIDAHVDARPGAVAARNGGKALHLAFRLEVDDDACGEGRLEIGVGLARTREADRVGPSTGFERDLELAGGSDIQSVDESRE